MIKDKSLRELTDDEFADEINKALDLIDKVKKPDYIDAKDKKDRQTKIQKLANDPLANRELQQEDNIELQKDFQKQKAREKELNKYNQYRTIEQFKINFFRSIKNQVEQVEDEEETYSKINAPMEDSGIIRPGERLDTKLGDIPSVDLFFDRSGSWDNAEAIRIGNEAVATIKEFADKGEIKLNVYYFQSKNTGAVLSTKEIPAGGGTHCWNAIIQQIKHDNAKNVVLMTDTDMEDQAASHGICKIDGEVWFIWWLSYQGTTGGRQIPRHLIGKRGNHQYAFGKGATN